MIEIDGSEGEGGGAILRTATCLSLLTQKPFKLINIRAKRPNPGLRPSHLVGLEACRQLFKCTIEGAHAGSTNLIFRPGQQIRTRITLDIGTAGSITLVLQSLLLPLLVTGRAIHLTIKGGTDVRWSPSWDFFANVHIPILRRFGRLDTQLLKRGYYPKGGGEAHLHIQGICDQDLLPPLKFNSKIHPVVIEGICHAHLQLEQPQIAQQMSLAATASLGGSTPVRIRTEYTHCQSVGFGITVWARCAMKALPNQEIPITILGADELGNLPAQAQELGAKAASNLTKLLLAGHTIDPHHADMLIPVMALAKGSVITTSTITEHTTTNIRIAKKFCETEFTIDKNTISSS